MARRFAKVSEEEIVAINEAAFFYPSDLVNTKTTIPLRIGGYVPRRFAFRYISTTIHLPPSGDSCIISVKVIIIFIIIIICFFPSLPFFNF